jgi:hypothetical protein
MKTMPEIQNKELNFEFRHVSPVEVEKWLLTIKNRTSGVYYFPLLLLEFKQVVVTQLIKGKGDSKSLDSYKGISVLPAVSKLFEKMLADQMRV